MKKQFCCIILILIFLSSHLDSYSSQRELFLIDDKKLEKTFESLNELEVQVENGYTLLRVTDLQSTLINTGVKEPPLGIPSILWGCTLGIVGLFFVFQYTDSKYETSRALVGCYIQGSAIVIVYMIYFYQLATN